MPGQEMHEAPCAVDRTGGYYPVHPVDHRTQDAPPSATHYTYDPATGEVVDWLRECVIKSSRGRPSDDPWHEGLFDERGSVESERARCPGVGLFLHSVYEVVGQVAP